MDGQNVFGATACAECGCREDLRFGICFDCASAGELRAARRTVAQHLAKAARNLRRGGWKNVRYDMSWAWERLSRTGDYRPGGYFDREYPGWR